MTAEPIQKREIGGRNRDVIDLLLLEGALKDKLMSRDSG
jgi:hypothetical protein